MSDDTEGHVAFHKNVDINLHYDMGREIGSGHFSTVYAATRKDDGVRVAVKAIDKDSVEFKPNLLDREVSILGRVKHPNIIALLEVFDNDDYFYMVLEYVTGGELFDQIVRRGRYSEKDAANVIKEITEAVKYLHEEHGIAHRDLKPENLLCATDADDAPVKIADFGLSKIVSDSDILATACGTPGYVAPEVLLPKDEHGYTTEVDLWSIGVISYILLCGFPPFYDEEMPRLFKQIINADFSFPSPYWDDVSDGAKDLINRLLVKSPAERYTCQDVLDHAWIKENAPDTQLEHVSAQFGEWNAKRALKSAVHAVIVASSLTHALDDE